MYSKLLKNKQACKKNGLVKIYKISVNKSSMLQYVHKIHESLKNGFRQNFVMRS